MNFSKEDFWKVLANKDILKKEDGVYVENIDLSFVDLRNRDLSWLQFKNVNFKEADFSNSDLSNTLFINCNFEKANFFNAILVNSDLRGCNLAFSNIDGANVFNALLEDSNLEGIQFNEKTKHFKMHCPEEGYFFGYKKCFNNRMVKLLIPKDSKRSSGTTNACRCEKAKVVSITDTKKEKTYSEAYSFVDENFIYKLGQYVYADEYTDNRWKESTHGIHFWMTFEEALNYM